MLMSTSGKWLSKNVYFFHFHSINENERNIHFSVRPRLPRPHVPRSQAPESPRPRVPHPRVPRPRVPRPTPRPQVPVPLLVTAIKKDCSNILGTKVSRKIFSIVFD